MEEKERYVIDCCDELIFDTEKEYYPSGDTICKTLNRQDKRIKELEEDQALLTMLISGIDNLMHDKDYRFKNDNGTWYSRQSCKDLTNEEVYQEIIDEINQLDSNFEILDKENQQLKQQLSESETQLKEEIEEKNGVKRALSACNRQNDEFADMIKKLVNENEELKQQLVESEKSKELYRLQDNEHHSKLWQFYSRLGVEAFGEDIHEKALDELGKLKQQLHDLPKKIVEEIRDVAGDYWEECGNVPDLNTLTMEDFDEILDAILEKYGDKNEINND